MTRFVIQMNAGGRDSTPIVVANADQLGDALSGVFSAVSLLAHDLPGRELTISIKADER